MASWTVRPERAAAAGVLSCRIAAAILPAVHVRQHCRSTDDDAETTARTGR